MSGDGVPARADQRPATTDAARRRFLKFLLHSPLVAGAGALLARDAIARPEFAVPETLAEALDIFQIERAAQRALSPDIWHFIVNGADDMTTVAANRSAFDAWQIRVRRLIDVSRVTLETEVLGERLPSPIILAPVGAQQSIHADGEPATLRAASARGHLMIASTVTNSSIGEIRNAGAAPLWFQLYASPDEPFMRHLIAGAEAAGCRALALTVDSPTRGNREGEQWFAARKPRGPLPRLGNFANYAGPSRIGNSALTWDIVDWLRRNTRMKLLLKGIVTGEDAKLVVHHGVDGIIVSNHGGRQEESGRGTLECLPEIVDAVDGRLPVLIDGGFRRGTDVYKALALGAQAVCIGRPYLFGLAAWGEPGVAKVLSILDAELRRIMQFAGVTRVTGIQRASVSRRGS